MNTKNTKRTARLLAGALLAALAVATTACGPSLQGKAYSQSGRDAVTVQRTHA